MNGLDDDTGHNAAQLLSELAGGGQRLKALIVQRDRSSTPAHLHLLLYTSGHDDSAAESVNAQLLIEGLARLRLPPPAQVGHACCACMWCAEQRMRILLCICQAEMAQLPYSGRFTVCVA